MITFSFLKQSFEEGTTPFYMKYKTSYFPGLHTSDEFKFVQLLDSSASNLGTVIFFLEGSED
jgi:hypothetical protein